jgi:uncharacterized surface protein with fasciclin (FAS1) repeats
VAFEQIKRLRAMRDPKAAKGITHSVTAALLLSFAAASQVQAEPPVTGFLAPAAIPGSAVATTSNVRSDSARRKVPSAALAAGLGDFVDGAGSIAFFGSLLRAASLGDLLQPGETYTLFVPVDGAFAGLTGQQISDLIHDPRSLRALVAGHILPGRVLETDLKDGQAVFSISGDRIEPNLAAGPQINGATLIKTPLAGPVVIHVIDGLLHTTEPGDA